VPPTRMPAAALLDAIRSARYPWWYPENAKGLAVDAFNNVTDFLPLGIGATASITNTILISNDSAFVILTAAMVVTDTTNLIFLAQRPIMVDLFDGGSSRHFSNTPVHADNWFGTAEEPCEWVLPKLLAPNGAFNITLTNLDTAASRNVRVSFNGFKIFGFTP
jgi:hypothetical protein